MKIRSNLNRMSKRKKNEQENKNIQKMIFKNIIHTRKNDPIKQEQKATPPPSPNKHDSNTPLSSASSQPRDNDAIENK